MKVKIKTLMGAQHAYEMDQEKPLHFLCDAIYNTMGVPQIAQRFVLNGKLLDKEKSCRELQITEQHVLILVLDMYNNY